MSAQEITLHTPNGCFAALAWPNPGAPRLMCLHGWLDNAASFLPLGPFLKAFDLVALDFAGHGHSDHRPAGARYYMMDNLWDLDMVLDALGWPNCHLAGHSLGGVVACTYAAAAPGRVDRLVALDGLGPLSARPGNTTARIRASLASFRKPRGKLKDYPDIEAAARTRERASGLPIEASRLLCERSMSWHNGIYRWRTDPELNWHSPLLMSEEQVLDILGAISVPTLSITASPLTEWMNPAVVKKRLATVPDCTSHVVEGHHHFHMDQPQQTAQFILDFLNAPERKDESR